MVTLLDTSALVASLVLTHPRHRWALPFLKGPDVHICAHSIAELYSALSASPQLHLTAAQAVSVVEHLLEQVAVVLLDVSAYQQGIRRVASLGLSGGAIYDALIAEAALSAGADQLVTLNAKHFVRLGPEIAEIVVTPEQ